MSNTTCSVCQQAIEDSYCAHCGQYHTNRQISLGSLLADLLNSLFSVEKSLWGNLKTGLLQPRFLVENYWRGFRRYYFSPGKFATIASLFVIFNFSVAGQFFSIKTVSSESLPEQFVFLLIFFMLCSIVSSLVFRKWQRNFVAHLVLNLYTVSLWTILFSPLSLLTVFLRLPSFLNSIFLVLYVVLILYWNARVFPLSTGRRVLLTLLSILLFGGLVGLILWKSGL